MNKREIYLTDYGSICSQGWNICSMERYDESLSPYRNQAIHPNVIRTLNLKVDRQETIIIARQRCREENIQ